MPGLSFELPNPLPRARIRVVLFDLDGTLIRTSIDFAAMKRAVIALAQTYGADAQELGALDILAGVARTTAALAAGNRRPEATQFRQEAFALLRSIETRECADPVLIRGASEITEALRAAGVRVGIVTRNCRDVSAALTRTGRLSHDVLLSRDDVEQTKPDPSHLLEALRRLGRPDAAHAVMVGDNWMDMAAGAAAGMRTVGVLDSNTVAHFGAHRPDVAVRTVADMLHWFSGGAGGL